MLDFYLENRALIEEWAKCASLSDADDPFRDIPWNGSTPKHSGYRELSGSEIGSEVSAEMKKRRGLILRRAQPYQPIGVSKLIAQPYAWLPGVTP
jgi:hypothetical protein